MLLTEDLVDNILIEPLKHGADSLEIVSGYATPMMASRHIKMISSLGMKPINIKLLVGMSGYDGLTKNIHEGFKNLVAENYYDKESKYDKKKSTLNCQYVYKGNSVHSKLYIWKKDGKAFRAFAGSANYSQAAFYKRREIMTECNPNYAVSYFDSIEKDTIICNHSEVENHIRIHKSHPILEQEEMSTTVLKGSDIESVTLSLLSRNGETGARSGLNWGQRPGRDPNQAYIPLPAQISRSGFFPLEDKHFSIITDDSIELELRVEQENNKAITSPLKNALLGEYFRYRLGVPNGAFVKKENLEGYGRTDVTFYKFDEESFYMDFSV